MLTSAICDSTMHLNDIPRMQFSLSFPVYSYELSSTKYVWEYTNNALWDIVKHTLFLFVTRKQHSRIMGKAVCMSASDFAFTGNT